MIRNNKILSFVERIEGNHRPITADIFLTDYCNLSCTYCRYSHSTGDYMAFADFKTYVHRLLSLGVRAVILTGGGEPTISPDFEQITSYMESEGIPYGINTNLVKPVRCQPNFLKVSVDSGIDANFARARGADKLKDVLNNIRNYVSTKTTKTRVGVQCVATTEENVVSFVKTFAGIPVDYIYIRPVESKSVGRVTSAHVLTWLEANGIKDKRVRLSYKFNLMGKRFKHCVANWSTITVNQNGNVLFCCNKPNEVVGHILDQNILDKKDKYPTNMKLCEVPCRLSGANDALCKPMENDIFFI